MAIKKPSGRQKVLVATPCYTAKLWVSHVECLMALFSANLPGIDLVWGKILGNTVTRARNNLADYAVDQKFDKLLFIDDDVLFTPQDAQNVLCHHVGVVGGLYPLKCHPSRWVITEIKGAQIDPKTGLLEVREVGTGFKAISVQTFVALIRAFPEREYVADDRPERVLQHDLFPMGVINGRYLSEDYYFDHLCHQIKIPVYADTRICLKHRGSVDFPLGDIPLPGEGSTQPEAKPAIVPSAKYVEKVK